MVIARPNRGSDQQKVLYEKEKETRKCPSCHQDAKAVDIKDDRITYKCDHCGALNTHTITASKYKRKPKTKKHKRSAFILRDKSGEAQKKETRESDHQEGPPKPVSEELSENTKTEDRTPSISKTVDVIRESMQNRNILTFNYRSVKGAKSNRAVEPYKIERNSKGEIYLWAWCQENNGIRRFKLSGISSVIKQDYPFEPKFNIEDKL